MFAYFWTITRKFKIFWNRVVFIMSRTMTYITLTLITLLQFISHITVELWSYRTIVLYKNNVLSFTSFYTRIFYVQFWYKNEDGILNAYFTKSWKKIPRQTYSTIKISRRNESNKQCARTKKSNNIMYSDKLFHYLKYRITMNNFVDYLINYTNKKDTQAMRSDRHWLY